MDWNAKWGWENLGLFNLKTFENPKHQTTDWVSSGTELAPGSLARSSISVCTDSSSKEVMKKTQAAFGIIHAFSGDFRKKEDLGRAEQDELSSPLESSVSSGKSLIGLKLGKRMHFENNNIWGSTETVPLPGVPCSSIASTVKKIKSLNSNTTSRCQVEGCSLDLSSAKEYYRKHKICANHSKCPKVVVGCVECRFCQKCSRFHSLLEFDEKKRSCRKQLSSHNVRRRKPQLDSIGFNKLRLPSPLSAFTSTEERSQMSFVLNNIPNICPISSSDSSFKFTTTNGSLLQFEKTRGFDEQLQLAGTGLPLALSLPGHCSNVVSSFMGTKSETLTQGFEESILAPNLDSAPDFHRALYLLSNNSWGSYQPSNNSLDHSMNVNHMHHQPPMQAFPQTFAQTSSKFCQVDHHSTNSLAATANAVGHFQLFEAPYEDVLYSNLFN